jgi:hypothetical protein
MDWAFMWEASSLNPSGTGPVAAILANSRCQIPRWNHLLSRL